MEQKNITLACGIAVTIRRRSWASVHDSVKAAARAVEELEKSGLSPDLKELKLVELRLDQRDKALADSVEAWPELRDLLSVHDIVELEKAVDDFSKAEVVAGN